MRNTFKRVLSFILALTMVLGLGVNAFAIPSPTRTFNFYVGIDGEFDEQKADIGDVKLTKGNTFIKTLEGAGLTAAEIKERDDLKPYLTELVWDGSYWKNKNRSEKYDVNGELPTDGDSVNVYINFAGFRTVTFDPNDGEFVDGEFSGTKEVVKGSEVGELPIAEKDEFTFDGWFDNKSGTGTAITAETLVTKKITYYAKWTAIPKYTVTFNANGGALDDPEEATRVVFKDEAIGELPAASRAGYVLDGWYKNTEEAGTKATATTKITENTTYKAKWAAGENSVVLHYVDTEGNEIDPDVVVPVTNGEEKGVGFFDSYYHMPEGYTFDHIYDTKKNVVTNPNEDDTWDIPGSVEYFYTYTKNNYTVAMKGYDGTNTIDYGTAQVDYKGELSLDVFPETYENRALVFFEIVAGSESLAKLPADKETVTWTYDVENPEVWANYSDTQLFTVTALDTDGEELKTITDVPKGTYFLDILPEIPEKTGYTGSWVLNGGTYTITGSDKVDADYTARMKYTANTYEAHFISNEKYVCGKGGVTYGQKIKNILATMANIEAAADAKVAGHDLIGWKVGEDIYTISDNDAVWEFTENVIFEAVWEPKQIPVTLNANGGIFDLNGSEVIEIEIPYGVKVNEYLKNYTPALLGRKLAGWNTDPDATTVFDDDVSYDRTEGTTIYAIWYAAPVGDITVKFFDLDGSTHIGAKTVKYNSKITGLGSIAVTGLGAGHSVVWMYYPDGKENPGVYITEGERWNYDVTTTMYVYAVAETNSYKVTFDCDGGELVDEEDMPNVFPYYPYNEPYGWLPTATKYGYDFDGWLYGGTIKVTEDDILGVPNDITLKAKWTPKKVDIYFLDEEDNELFNHGTVVFGFTLETALETPAKTGYDFKGWYDGDGKLFGVGNSVDVEDKFILTAKFTPKTYNVWFFAKDYTGHGTNAKINGIAYIKSTAVYGEAIEFPAEELLTNPGYDLVGWTDKNGFDIKTYNIAADSNIYAKWAPHTYTVTFNVGEGGYVDPATKEVKYREAIGTLPVAIKEGYTSTGWKWGVHDILATTPYDFATEDVELTPVWVANDWLYHGEALKAVLDLDGGAITTTNTTYTIRYDMELNLPAPTKVGYDFAGWQFVGTEKEIPEMEEALLMKVFAAEPEVKLYKNGDIWDVDAEELKLKAVWTPIKYTVEFNLRGGTFYDAKWKDGITVTYGEKVGDQLPGAEDFYKVGYTFECWENNAGVVRDENTVWNFTQGDTFYARWKANTYKITFDTLGGTITNGITEKKVTYDEKIGTLPIVEKLGYEFAGWYIEGTDGVEMELIESTTVYNETNKCPAENVLARAHWVGNTYNVIYHGNGGVTVVGGAEKWTDTSAQYGKVYMLSGAEHWKREGYEFVRWTTDQAGLNPITNKVYNTIGHTDVYAQWREKVYEVTLNINHPTGKVTDALENAFKPGKVTVKYNQKLSDALATADISVANLTVDGYVTTGEWYTDRSGHGTEADPYVATGLYDANVGKALSSNITLYAGWEAATFKVTYQNDKEDATGMPTTQCFFAKYKSDIIPGQLPTLSKPGYEFKGWQYAGDGAMIVAGNNNKWQMTSDIDIYAVWKEKYCNITFKYNNGDILNAQDTGIGDTYQYNIKYDTPITFPNGFTKKGFEFAGWYYGDTRVDVGTPVNFTYLSDIVLEAHWTPVPYKVAFVDKGKTIDEKFINYGMHINEILPIDRTPAEGYYFDGWYYENQKIGENDIYRLTSNATFDAVYKPYTYGVVFNTGAEDVKFSNDATTKEVNLTFDAEIPTGTFENITRTGYRFDDWYYRLNLTGEKKVENKNNWKIVPSNGDVKLEVTAKWIPETYKIDFVLNEKNLGNEAEWLNNTYDNDTLKEQNGADNFANKTVTYDAAIDLPDANTMTLDGYTFAGWYYKEGDNFVNVVDGSTWTKDMGADGAELKIYAKWNAVKYTVGYDVIGNISDKYDTAEEFTLGTEAQNFEIYYDTIVKANMLPTPTKVGYIYNNWNAGTTPLVAGTTRWVWTNITEIDAQWTAEKYTITFIRDDSASDNPAQQGFNIGHGTATNDRFTNNLETKVITYDEVVTLPVIQNEKGYKFESWRNKEGTVTYGNGAWKVDFTEGEGKDGAATFYALWIPQKYTVTFSVAKGNGIEAYKKGTRITEIRGLTSTNKTVKPEFDTKITAAQLPDLTLSGYNFLGWYTADGHKVGPDTDITAQYHYWKNDENVILEAKWAPKTYKAPAVKFTFNEEGNLAGKSHGTIVFTAPTNFTVTYDKRFAANTIAPTCPGYNFLGWKLGRVLYTADGKTYFEAPLEKLHGNDHKVKFDAEWAPKTYTVTIDAKGGVLGGANPKANAKYAENLGFTATRTGYTLDGFYYGNTTKVYGRNGEWVAPVTFDPAGNKATGAFTVAAKWTANTYTVTFNPGTYGSVYPKSRTVVYDQPYGDLPTPSYGSYRFLYWVDQNNTIVDANSIYRFAKDTTLHAQYKGSSSVTLDYRNSAGLDVVPGETEVIFLGEVEAVEQIVVETPAEEAVVETPAEEAVVETPAEEAVVETPAEEVVETPAEEAVVETPAEEVVEETTEVVIENKTSAAADPIVATEEVLIKAAETGEVIVIKADENDEPKAVRVISVNAEKGEVELEEVTEINPDTGAPVSANIAPAMFALLAAAAFAFGKRK